jgi:hypothetical protein
MCLSFTHHHAAIFAALLATMLLLDGTAGVAAQQAAPQCKPPVAVARVSEPAEGSGVAASRRPPGRFWSHNDSGDATLIALDRDGRVAGRLQYRVQRLRIGKLSRLDRAQPDRASMWPTSATTRRNGTTSRSTASLSRRRPKAPPQCLRSFVQATMVAAAYMVVQLDAQTTVSNADFTNAAVAEVRDAQGQLVLSGSFQVGEEEDDDVERKAILAPAGGDADAAGDAEVEYAKNAPAQQEVEFSVRNLARGVAFTFVIDGTTVATATTDSRGRAEVELEVRMPGAVGSR